MTAVPKPEPKVKVPKPLRRGQPMARRKRLKAGNAYTRSEWRAKVREIRRRSGGICEARVRCNGDPVSGDPHHLRYQREFKGWKRLMVPNDQLVDCCRRCHLWYEEQKGERDGHT